MKTVYRQTEAGWIRVCTCQSFEGACIKARELESETGMPHCVNTDNREKKEEGAE